MMHAPRERRTVHFPPHVEGPPVAQLQERFLWGLILLVVLMGIFILFQGCASRYRQQLRVKTPAEVRASDGVLVAEAPLRKHNPHGDYVRFYQYEHSQELVYYRDGKVCGTQWRETKQ